MTSEVVELIMLASITRASDEISRATSTSLMLSPRLLRSFRSVLLRSFVDKRFRNDMFLVNDFTDCRSLPSAQPTVVRSDSRQVTFFVSVRVLVCALVPSMLTTSAVKEIFIV